MSYLSSTYTYDPENRLASTSGMSYTYDGNGERVLKSNTSTGAAVKRYWPMGGNTLAEGDGAGNLTAEYIYFGGKRVARIDLPANTVHYYLSDHLGSTSIIVGAAGAVEEESDYYPFGTQVVVTGPGANELKFTGKRRDTESQLDYFGARYFDNPFGRFMTPDPLMASAYVSNPQTWNRYAYARNNPLRFVDPTGMNEESASDCAKDKKCVTVKINVIYDKKANDGKGLTDKQIAGFGKQLQEAKDEYGTAHIHFDVGYGTDADKGALNVIVSDSTPGNSSGMSGISKNGYAVTFIGMNKADNDTLSHEIAHHITGDTTGIMNSIAKHDPTGMIGLLANTLADISNDMQRESRLQNQTRREPGTLRAYLQDERNDGFTLGAKSFQQMLDQNAIQPQKK